MLLGRDDVIRALKRCKRLAKQDLLASPAMSDPDYWRSLAETRRTIYDQLLNHVERFGADGAYQRALAAYAALPSPRGKMTDAAADGRRQAYEMFFTILGVPKNNLKAALTDDRSPVEVG